MALLATAEGPLDCVVLHEEADPSRGAFVLLHGIQGTAAAWSEVARQLGSGRRIVMPNLRGRAGSLAPDDPSAYGLGAFAGDLDAVIAGERGPITLVGWSMGVLVALSRIASHGTARIDALLLASGTPCPGGEAIWFRAEGLDALAHEARERAVRLNLAAFARPEAVAGAWASVRGADRRPVLSGIDVPTLVLHGTGDDQCPLAHGRAMAAAIPGAEFDAWVGSGHNLMAEDPARFSAAIRRLYAMARRDMVVIEH